MAVANLSNCTVEPCFSKRTLLYVAHPPEFTRQHLPLIKADVDQL